jgi:hypothetical protein
VADDDLDVWELLPAYALDAVDDLERRAVERLLDSDAAARQALDEYRDVVAAFTVEAAPPAHVRDAVMSRVAGQPDDVRGADAPPQDDGTSREEPASDGGTSADGVVPDGVVPFDRSRRRRRWGLVAVAAAAVVAVAVPTTVAIQATQERQLMQERADAVAQMMADPSARLMSGEVSGGGAASVLVAGDDYLFSANGLPGPGEGQDYQLWVVGAEGDVAPAGVLTTHDGAVEHLVHDMPGVGVAVTTEPEGGSDQPTSDPIVVLAEG